MSFHNDNLVKRASLIIIEWRKVNQGEKIRVERMGEVLIRNLMVKKGFAALKDVNDENNYIEK